MNHPILPCGYNADDNNGDEVDGAGTNWPIWPSLFDTFIGLVPLIVTEEMLKVFVVECSDVAFSWDSNIIAFPYEQTLETITDDWGPLLIAGESDALILSREAQTQAIRSEKPSLAIVGKSDTLTLPDEADSAAMRKAG